MIIFLSGPKDAGKTTTARKLRMLIPHSVIVETDNFFSIFPKEMNLLEKAVLCVELSALSAKHLFLAGFTVIMPYPVSDADYKRHMDCLKGVPKEKIVFFTLVPEKTFLLKRLKLSKSNFSLWRRAVINEHYKSGIEDYGIVRPKYSSIIIDNSKLTPLQTAKVILAHLKLDT
jgi:hypothetical protein